MFAVSGCLLCLLVPAAPEPGFLGLTARSAGLSEGPTDYAHHLRPSGTVRAVMLFARFPDTEAEETTQALHDLLVPRAVDYYRRASYGQVTLSIEPVPKWLPLARASTSGDYDCSRFEPHKRYLTEVVRLAEGEVDFARYDVVYIVGSRAKGVPNSPTFIAPTGAGVTSRGRELRWAVTFGNDVRGWNWGWQTLVHETGHLFGLPDLYLYEKRDWHRAAGAWDPMGLQMPGAHFLAWHKYKLGWLRDEQMVIVRAGAATVDLTPIAEAGGVKAVVMPVSASEAWVAEARRHDAGDDDPLGLLVYRVSTTTAGGCGPVKVLPARADDGNPAWKRLYEKLYSALWFEGVALQDAEQHAAIEIVERRETGIRVRASR
jgi:M6 family metalloprotease-like protein